MLMAITDPEGFAILLTILVATALSGRVLIFAIETSRPFLLLGSWLLAMVGGAALWSAAQNVMDGFRPVQRLDLVGAFVRRHNSPLASLLRERSMGLSGTNAPTHDIEIKDDFKRTPVLR